MLGIFTGRHGRVAAGLLIGEFSSAMQGLVVAAIMPRVASDLHGLPMYGFAFGIFLAANFVTLPFAGPWADRFGTRRVLACALGLNAVGMLACALAPNMYAFIGGRTVEGVANGLDYVVSFTAIARTFSEDERPQMFALASAMWIVPGLVGPGLGAAIATIFGWRWAFAIFIPFVVLSATLALPALDAGKERSESSAFGALRMLFSKETLSLADSRHTSFVAFAILQAAFFGADAYVALALTAVRGMSLATASLCITCGVLGWAAASAVQPRLLQSASARAIVMAGAGLGCMGIATMLGVNLGLPSYAAFAAWIAAGAAMGLAYPTISIVALANAERGSEGEISSATLMAGMLGMTVGTLLCGLPITAAAHAGAPLRDALAITFAMALLGTIGLGLVALKLPATLSPAPVE